MTCGKSYDERRGGDPSWQARLDKEQKRRRAGALDLSPSLDSMSQELLRYRKTFSRSVEILLICVDASSQYAGREDQT